MANNLTRLNPFGEIARFDPFRDMERFFEEFERGALMPWLDPSRNMRIDVSETDQAYSVKAEVPGFDKQDINVSVDGNQVCIRAKRDEQQQQKDQEGNMVRSERFHGEQCRIFSLPVAVDDQQASATCKDGILELVLPKKPGIQGRQLQIQ